MTLQEFTNRTAVKFALSYVEKKPEERIEKFAGFVKKLVKREDAKKELDNIISIYKSSPGVKGFIDRIFKEIHPKAREKFILNLYPGTLFWINKRLKRIEETGVHIPTLILIDPTERCNLRCKGCWAGEYQQGKDMDKDLFKRIIKEGKDLGIGMYFISGGEPLLVFDTIYEIAKKNPDIFLHIYTNGTLIDEEIAKKTKDAANIVFALSIEGDEKATDERRGKGVYQRVMKSAEILKKEGIPFGFSITYTKENTEILMDENFVKDLISKGFIFGWYFTYIPIGINPDLNLMATPEQRAQMAKFVRYVRDNLPIAAFDFWNDGELVQGCIAGGRYYFHIIADGTVEPCAFVHFSNCNIKDKSLLEVLQNPLFKAYQKRQPFNTNMYKPCPLIDNPELLREILEESKAVPTHPSALSLVKELKNGIDEYAKRWGKLAEKVEKEIKEKEMAKHR